MSARAGWAPSAATAQAAAISRVVDLDDSFRRASMDSPWWPGAHLFDREGGTCRGAAISEEGRVRHATKVSIPPAALTLGGARVQSVPMADTLEAAAPALLAGARALFESDLDAAREGGRRALEAAVAAGDGATQVEARLLLGECFETAGDHPGALAEYELALATTRRLGNPRREAEIERLMAFSHDNMGDFEAAHAHHLAALR